MLLGGIRYLLPVIKAAHEQGYHVITADYLPDNIAHQYSDEYVNVNIVDKEAVLRVAREKQIDGIMSFGVDPGVVSASYVQNQMGLPSFGPFESVVILQNKDKFRAFLQKHGFNVPQAKGFSSVEDAMSETYWYPWPVIVKPTDAAGSKGVTRVDKPEDLKQMIRSIHQGARVMDEQVFDKFVDAGIRPNSNFDKDKYTAREIEIIEAVASGLSNKEIAEKLFISEGTVKNYISNILLKEGLAHRTQLAVYYLTGRK